MRNVRRYNTWPALRHEKIAFITGPLNLKSALARKDAFIRSMRQIGMAADPEVDREGNHTLGAEKRHFRNC